MPHSFGIGLLVVLRHPSGKRPHGLDNDSPIVFNIRQKKLLRDSPPTPKSSFGVSDSVCFMRRFRSFKTASLLKKKHFISKCFFAESAASYPPRGLPQVLSAFAALTAVFGMGTGGSPQLSPLNLFQDSYPDNCIKMFVLTSFILNTFLKCCHTLLNAAVWSSSTSVFKTSVTRFPHPLRSLASE